MVEVKEVPAAGLRGAVNAISKGGRLPLQAMFANDERALNGCFCL